MSLFCDAGSVETDLSLQQLHDLLVESLAKLGKRNRVLVVPPDQSRVHSRAGGPDALRLGVLPRPSPHPRLLGRPLHNPAWPRSSNTTRGARLGLQIWHLNDL